MNIHTAPDKKASTLHQLSGSNPYDLTIIAAACYMMAIGHGDWTYDTQYGTGACRFSAPEGPGIMIVTPQMVVRHGARKDTESLKIEIPITQEHIDSMVVTAFESDCAEWLGKAVPVGEFKTNQQDPGSHERYTDREGKWRYQIIDSESGMRFERLVQQEEQQRHFPHGYRDLTRETLLAGYQLYVNHCMETGEDFVAPWSTSYDAEIADLVVQYAVFQHVVFG